MEPTLIQSKDGPIATLTLNRPDALNAIDVDMSRRMREAGDALEADPHIRVVVIRGAGRAFVAGGDVRMFHDALPDPWQVVGEVMRNFHHFVTALNRMPKLVLASVHGAVAGGGLSLALACDLVVAAEGTRFAVAYGKLGTSPDGGCTHFLSRALGQKQLAELMFHADGFDAGEALRLGLINRVVAADALAEETACMARRLAGNAPAAVAATKALIKQAPTASLADQLAAEEAAFRGCAGTADFAEGVRAFVERRIPAFA